MRSSIAISGGSELYRIDASGNPLKLWSNAQDIAYAIGFDGVCVTYWNAALFS